MWDRGRAAEACFIPVGRRLYYLIHYPPFRTSPLAMTPCTMEHLNISQFLGMLVVMLLAAKVAGYAAPAGRATGGPGRADRRRPGRPIGLGLVNPSYETIHLLSELGVVILLFAIGLETDLGELPKVGATFATVAVVGVALPFALGFAACRLLGYPSWSRSWPRRTLTATSVGITARVLADLGRFTSPEGQIILGAAVIDDILGLLILTIVAGLPERGEVSWLEVVCKRPRALWVSCCGDRLGQAGRSAPLRWPAGSSCRARRRRWRLIAAFGLAWLADRCGSAMIIGAFAAGLVVVAAPQAHEIERGITEIGHFFVPLFFVTVGASVDLSALDPFQPASRFALLTGGVLIVVGVAGKLAAGYAPFWFRGNKTVIGVGMVLAARSG